MIIAYRISVVIPSASVEVKAEDFAFAAAHHDSIRRFDVIIARKVQNAVDDDALEFRVETVAVDRSLAFSPDPARYRFHRAGNPRAIRRKTHP